ncbi:PREDICTED: protein ATP1B4 isoform X1 [Sturnus vulgaris]|nr:PREDICTED: protein ATP1B4 isoform X1 [Sturnus vulgaris]
MLLAQSQHQGPSDAGDRNQGWRITPQPHQELGWSHWVPLYATMPGGCEKGKRECWVRLLERAEAGGHTDLVLTQLWEGPCSKRDAEPKSSYPSPAAADSPAPRNTRVCVQGWVCKLPPPPQALSCRGRRAEHVCASLWDTSHGMCSGCLNSDMPVSFAGLILLFYFIFYTCLAGMFAFCLYVMLLTLSPYTPRYRDRVSPPGVMIRPYLNGFTIAFNVSQPNTWQPYVDSMHHFLAAYDDKVQEEKNIECVPGQYFIQGGNDSEEKKACQFKRSLLQNCSGIEDPTFGYSKGQPCILLKMNRIIGYRPGAGVPVSVDCKVQKGNESHLRSVDFYPGNGTFDLMYYPYYGKFTHVNYTSPLVAMHFTDVQKNYLVPIQCSLNGKGIINDLNSDRFLGRIIFTLSIGK